MFREAIDRLVVDLAVSPLHFIHKEHTQMQQRRSLSTVASLISGTNEVSLAIRPEHTGHDWVWRLHRSLQ